MAGEFANALRHTDPAARTLARVDVTPELILRWLASGGRERPVVVGLPEDAELYSINYDFCTQTLGVAVSHPSFPPVPPGTMIPLLPLEVRIVPADDAGDDE